METRHKTQTITMVLLTRLSVTSIRCLMGNRTAKNLSIVIRRRFEIENVIEYTNMFAKLVPPSRSIVLCVMRSNDLSAAIDKPTNTSDTARLSRSLSKAFLLLHRIIRTISAIFRNAVRNATIMNTSSLPGSSIIIFLSCVAQFFCSASLSSVESGLLFSRLVSNGRKNFSGCEPLLAVL